MCLKKYILILSCILLYSTHFCYAQSESDSLLQVAENYPKEDTLKVMMLLDLANSYWRSLPENSEMYGKQGLALAEKLNYKFGVARACVIITNALISKGELEKSMEYAHLTLQKSKEAGFALGEGHAYKFMGSIYFDQGHVEEAKKYFKESIAVYTRLKHERHIGNTLSNLARIYGANNDLDSALFYYNEIKRMEYAKNSKLLLGVINNNIGLIFAEKGELNKAITAYLEALEMRRAAGDQMGEIITLENLGNAYRNKKDFLLAEQHLLEALHLAEELKLIRDRVFLYKDLVTLEKVRGNYEKALAYYDKYTLFNDSLLNEAKNRQIAELQTRYETEKKEKEIASLQLDNQTKAFWQKIYIAGLLLVAIIAIFVFLFYRYRNRLNRQLLQTQQDQTRQLQEIDRMKSRFFANISHEFRTPLTLILGPIDALQQEVKQESSKQQLQMMHRSAQRLLKLINQLLDLSRIEAGKLSLKASRKNIVPFVRGLFYSFHSMAEKKEIVLAFHSIEEEIFLYYEAEKIEQVITNLLSNAFKFTPQHGKISLTLQRCEWNGKACLEMVVKDTGIGIAKDQLPYVFDRFFQADTSDTKEHEGTGIGLALVKELLALHKGDITVESSGVV